MHRSGWLGSRSHQWHNVARHSPHRLTTPRQNAQVSPQSTLAGRSFRRQTSPRRPPPLAPERVPQSLACHASSAAPLLQATSSTSFTSSPSPTSSTPSTSPSNTPSTSSTSSPLRGAGMSPRVERARLRASATRGSPMNAPPAPAGAEESARVMDVPQAPTTLPTSPAHTSSQSRLRALPAPTASARSSRLPCPPSVPQELTGPPRSDPLLKVA